MEKVELFSSQACPYAQRSRMVLLEKGVDFELIEIDIFNRPDWFKDISPYGKVPLLRHGLHVIHESAIINQYLDETFPSPALMPAIPYGRAVARIWMDYCESRFLMACFKVLSEKDDPLRAPKNRLALHDMLIHMDQELRKLGEGPYWLGSEPTLVDFQFLPFFERFGVYEELGGVEWPAQCTALRRWYEAASARESFRQTAHSLDFHLEQRRRLQARLKPPAESAAAR